MLARRSLIKNGGLLGLGMVTAVARAADVIITPPQTQGPFYPIKDQIDKDELLVHYDEEGNVLTKGQVVVIEGRVLNEQEMPLTGALVEIWQACASGRYNHENDPNRQGELDPNFQYWARALTTHDGSYRFTTIVPGHYQASADWTRPPHIHFLVSAFGYPTLITQMYFTGAPLEQEDVINELNKKDRILKSIPESQRSAVIINFIDDPFGFGVPLGRFNIVLAKGVSSRATPRLD